MNGLLMQYFEWHLADDGKLWQCLSRDIPQLKKMGVTAVWIPPCYKGQNSYDVGYGAYDLYDLGEFDQKDTVRTKYGKKEELLETIQALQENDIDVYADIVINHKAAADATEFFAVVEVDPNDRDKIISKEYDIEGWTKFDFPGRRNTYSKFKWYHQHFTAVDFDQKTKRKAIFKISGKAKDFSQNVTKTEKGNFDYLMHADVDFNNPDVVEEIKNWGVWFVKEINAEGMRFDALKHIDLTFINEFIKHVKTESEKEIFMVGEYWSGNYSELENVLEQVDSSMSLFDVPLHFRFHDAAKKGANFDLRKIFDQTIIQKQAKRALTFVDNHDSQLGQSLESWVDDWFKPLAYALILLRKDGYPCLFYGDYYGSKGEQPTAAKKEILDPLLEARKKCAYGEEVLFLDDYNCIAIQRLGDKQYLNSGLVCILSNGQANHKEISFDLETAGTIFYDITGNIKKKVILDDQKKGKFMCNGGSVSVWVKEELD